MKIILVGINAKYIHPCLAIYQMQANTSYPVEIREFTIKESIEDIYMSLMKNNPEAIGFSCYLWNINMITKLISMIKANDSNIKIFLGGPEVAYDPEFFLKHFPIDYIVRSEGELVLPKLIAYFLNELEINKVPSLSYQKNNEIIHNKIELADLSKIELSPLNVSDYHNRIVYVESSRGCPYHCSYCCASLEKKVRFFPIKKIFQILKQLMKEKVKTVKFLDRTFNANKSYFIKILNFIKENNISTTFQFEIVADRLDLDLIPFIASFPKKCLRFEIGIQSINPKVNESVGRVQDMERLKKCIIELQKTKKVDLHLDLIAGLPFETKDSFISSFNEVFSYQPKELQLGFLKFLRGTSILIESKKHNYQYQLEPPYEIISNQYLTKEDLSEIKNVETVLDKYYNSGRFKKTFALLLSRNIIESFYHFFLKLYIFIKEKNFSFINSQLKDIYILFDEYFKSFYSFNYEEIHFTLIMDYLLCSKTRPKSWWKEHLTKEEKQFLFPLISKEILSLSIETLYRYSIVIQYKKTFFVIVFQDYCPKSYLLHDLNF